MEVLKSRLESVACQISVGNDRLTQALARFHAAVPADGPPGAAGTHPCLDGHLNAVDHWLTSIETQAKRLLNLADRLEVIG